MVERGFANGGNKARQRVSQQVPKMSVRRPTASNATNASNANRLSEVLAAGLERKFSHVTCRPCMPRVSADIGRLVDYDDDTDWSRITGDRYPNGPRFTKGCPDDNPDCDEESKIPVDAITLEQFNTGREIIILGCGHCFNVSSLERWARSKRSRKCVYNDYDMTDEELAELGLSPALQPLAAQGALQPPVTEIREDDEDGTVKVYLSSADGPVLVRVEYANGVVASFEGPRGEERIVRAQTARGNIAFFEGPRNQERVVRTQDVNGYLQFFEGSRGEERMVRIQFSDGSVGFFEGSRGQERMVRFRFANGDTVLVEGSREEQLEAILG